MRSKSGVWVVIVFVISLFSGVCSLRAQTASTGSITGTLTDPSGAAIPNATVTLVNSGTGQSQSATTNTDGSYRFSLLPPGTYVVKFSAQGFKSSQAPSVAVNITEVTVLDAKLEVGDTTQEVTVTGEAPIIQTESSGLGTLIPSKTLTSLPLTTRNYTQILSLAPGVVSNVNDASQLGRGTIPIDVNGQSTAANNFRINGTDANNCFINADNETVGPQSGGITVPNPDAIAEFKVQTAQYDAEYGRNPGGNVDVVTKSGTDEWHGSAFEFFRNTDLNANAFFLNQAGDPRAVMLQNQFGGTIGGPIKKDKLFVFGSEQETRQKNGLYHFSIGNAFTTAILPPLTNTDRTQAGLGAIYGGLATFAGGATVLPDGSNINPAALALLNYKLPNGTYLFPTPQTILPAGNKNPGQGFSAFSIPALFTEHQIVYDMDYIINGKNTLAEKWLYSKDPEFVPFLTPANVPSFPSQELFVNNDVSLTLTSTVSSTVVNELKGAYERISSNGHLEGTPTAATFGMAAFNPVSYPVIPDLTIGPSSYGGGVTSDTSSIADHAEADDMISVIRGKHSLRLGGTYERIDNHSLILGRSRGNAVTWETFQDFLLGESAAQNGSNVTGGTDESNIYGISINMWARNDIDKPQIIHDNYADLFIQDDFKVSRRLTLNLGLRWEYMGLGYDPTGDAQSTWYPTKLATVPVPPPGGTYVGLTVPSNYNPARFGPPPPGVTVLPYKFIFPNSTPLSNYAPRVGFAWQPGGNQSNFVVRGGYGWFYQFPSWCSTNCYGIGAEPFAFAESVNGTAVNTSTDQNIPQYNGVSPTGFGGLPPLGFTPRTDTTKFAESLGTMTDTFKDPYVQEYNMDLQYALGSWGLDLGYIGSYSSNQALTQYPNQSLLASPTSPVNCGYDGVSTDCITTNTAANAAQRAPILGFLPSGLSTGTGAVGKLWYNSLQASVTKRVSHGLTFHSSYTYGRNEMSSVFDGPAIEKVRTSYDRTHRLILNYDYALPVLSAARGFAKTMLSGWDTTGVVTVQSGLPLTLSDPRGGSVYGVATGLSTVTLCPGDTVSQLKTQGGHDQSRLNNWFNTAAVCAPAAVGGGTATGWGNTSQNLVTGAGQFNFDMGLGKITKVGGIHEDAQLQFRAEFYNAFNHPQFDVPGTTYGVSSYGVITNTLVAPRMIQFALKYIF